jgi:hypothetical protein
VLPVLVDAKPLPLSWKTHLIGGFLLSTAMTNAPTNVDMRGHDQTKYLSDIEQDGISNTNGTLDTLRIDQSYARGVNIYPNVQDWQ